DQHVLDDVRLAFDVDDLVADLAGNEAVALAHAAAVGADLLPEEIGIVYQAGGHAPGGYAVVPAHDGRATHERGTGSGPGGRADVRQVPVGGNAGVEVGIVGQERPAGRGARRGQGPVI